MKEILAAITATTVLTGCYIPEKFTAEVKFTEKGAYSVDFDGTVVNGMALLAKLDTKRPMTEAQIQQMEQGTWAPYKDVKFTYKGDARSQIQTTIRREPGQAVDVLGMLKITTDKNGVTTIRSPKVSAKDKQQLAELGVKINGSFTVELPKNAEVISHNADSTPKFFGMFGAYKWSVADPEKVPMMQVRFK